jgi:hypothetical protein
MNDRPLAELSQSGLARRERMHDELIAAMTTLHRRRRVRRHALVAAVVLLPMLLGAYAWFPSNSSTRPVQQIVRDNPSLPGSAHDAASLSLVQIVRTDPAILDRYVIAAPLPRVEILDDQRLVRELVALGRPAGVVRMEGRIWLTTDVTDDAQKDPDTDEAPTSSTGSLPDGDGSWRSVDARTSQEQTTSAGRSTGLTRACDLLQSA